MNHTGTPARTALRPGLVVDITDEALEQRRTTGQRHAYRSDSDVVRALMFAQGLDERGKRLPLASDSMTEEERHPHHVVAERQGPGRCPAEFAAVYRIADAFDDGLPNVSAIRTLSHKVRMATAEEASMSAAGAPRFAPRDVPAQLRALPRRYEAPGPHRRSVLAPTASLSVTPETSSPGVREIDGSDRSARRTNPIRPLTASTGRSTDGSSMPLASGSLALATPVPLRASKETAKPARPSLHAVSSAPKKITSYGVVAFWVLFVMGFLFVAVVMHAGIAHRQMTLDEINVQLEQSEYSNSQLRVEVASLQSPTRIAQSASRLGLSSPAGIRFVQAVPASIVASGQSASGRSASGRSASVPSLPADTASQTGG